MRLLVTLALAASTLSACLPFSCGTFNGSGDTVYARGSDSLMLCANGGFTLKLADGTTTEGRVQGDGTTETGTLEASTQVVFTLTQEADGTGVAPQLGAAPWTALDLDQTALDHADVQCSDLTTRSWWTATAAQ